MNGRTECPGCVGRGTGENCCMCDLPIPAGLRRETGAASEFPGVPLDGWPFPIVAREASAEVPA
ncbi:hypothetical protein [Catenuloplanes japonicus]|uniref:hypothetical protein n=1 Tax=Catenuloplanes japonicus TaxID=33876 RepID=UPI000527E591|nr:hypothetical protein [Catenuloplanes japonicus]